MLSAMLGNIKLVQPADHNTGNTLNLTQKKYCKRAAMTNVGKLIDKTMIIKKMLLMLLLLLDAQPINMPTINDAKREIEPNIAEIGKYFAMISFTLMPSYIKEFPKSKERVLLSISE